MFCSRLARSATRLPGPRQVSTISAATSDGGRRLGLYGVICSGLAGCSYLYSTRCRVEASTGNDQRAATATTDIKVPPLPKLDTSNGPAFSPDDVTIVFVLGGPGVGKGTQCCHLVKDYDFVHLSAGDLLREERLRSGSQYGELIEHYIREGKIVPQEITITLLHNAIKEHPQAKRFLIDGFPRNVEQGIQFELAVCPSKLVLFFECSEQEMLRRLMERSQNSGRVDDNIESIRKRFITFQESTMPVQKFYRDQEKLQTISCEGPIDQVYRRVRQAVDKI